MKAIIMSKIVTINKLLALSFALISLDVFAMNVIAQPKEYHYTEFYAQCTKVWVCSSFTHFSDGSFFNTVNIELHPNGDVVEKLYRPGGSVHRVQKNKILSPNGQRTLDYLKNAIIDKREHLKNNPVSAAAMEYHLPEWFESIHTHFIE